MGNKILIISEQPTETQQVISILANLKLDITVVTNAKEALAKLQETSDYSLIISDFNASGITTEQFVEHISVYGANHFFPIIIITDKYVEVDSFQKGILDGTIHFLYRPLVANMLLGKVNFYLHINEFRQDLLKSANFKSDFLSKMSHEIRSPLNGILGMADLLWESNLNSKQREWVKVFKRAGDHLLSVINDILDLSKIEAGQLNIERQDFNLRGLVEEVFELLSRPAQMRTVRFESIFEDDLEYIVADSLRLRQILINLVGNAIKFTQNGVVTIKVSKKDDTNLLISVIDQGIGIPPEKIGDLFKRFGQINYAGHRNYGDSGLGLKISKELIELMGGTIWVESQVSVGTTFHFTIPLEFSSFSKEEVKEAKTEKKDTVLLVEDDPSIRNYISVVLSDEYDVLMAIDGLEALTVVEQHQVDVIISDLNMPNMGGIEFIANLAVAGFNIPYFFVTGEENEEVKKTASKLTAIEILSKPFTPNELKERIEKVKRVSLKPHLGHIEDSVAHVSPPKEICGKILLVDDYYDNFVLVESLLAKYKQVSVDYADNGNVAIEMVQKSRYDLIFMDVNMPIMDGLTATKAIRGLEQNLGIKHNIVALTAYAIDEEIKKSLDSGCNDHLSKPINKKLLYEFVEKYLEQRRP